MSLSLSLMKKEYSIIGTNCADFCGDVGKGIGIDIEKPQKIIPIYILGKLVYIVYTDPKQQYKKAKKVKGAQNIDLMNGRNDEEEDRKGHENSSDIDPYHDEDNLFTADR